MPGEIGLFLSGGTGSEKKGDSGDDLDESCFHLAEVIKAQGLDEKYFQG